MKKQILTDKRKDKLADYALNISVASFAVAAFDGTWWGILSAFVGLALFFLLTRFDMAIWLTITAVLAIIGAVAVYESNPRKQN